MNVSRQRWLTSLGVLLLGGAVCAQSSPGSPERHDVSSLGMPANERAAQAILEAKLGKAQSIKNLDKLEELLRQVQNGQISREQLEEMAKLAENTNANKSDLTDAQRARLQKELQGAVKHLRERPDVPKEEVDPIEKQIEEVRPRGSGSGASSGSGSPMEKQEPPQGSGEDQLPDDLTLPPERVVPPMPPPKQEVHKHSGELTSKLVEQLFGKGGLLKSTNMTKILGGLTSPENGNAASGEGSHLRDLYQLLRSGHRSGESSNGSTSLLSRAKIPKFAGDAPRPSGGASDRGEGLERFALVVVGMIALGAGLYLVKRLWKKGSELVAETGWRLGPWPVNPAKVSTSEQFIQAFEYLAVLLLGRGARHRNHRQIAAGLKTTVGAEGQAERAAAEELTAIYEQARYAPVTEPLDGNQLAAARRDLILLAGNSVP